MTEGLRVHEPNKCFDPGYGADCDGIAEYVENPYIADVYGASVKEWICNGRYSGMIGDI